MITLPPTKQDGTPWKCTQTEFGSRGFQFAQAAATLDSNVFNEFCSFKGMFDYISNLLDSKPAKSIGPVYIGDNHQYWTIQTSKSKNIQLIFCGRTNGVRKHFVTGLDVRVDPKNFRDGSSEHPNGVVLPSPQQEVSSTQVKETSGISKSVDTPLKEVIQAVCGLPNTQSDGSEFLKQGVLLIPPTPFLSTYPKIKFEEQPYIDMMFSKTFQLDSQTQVVIKLFAESFYQTLLTVQLDPPAKNIKTLHMMDRSRAIITWENPVRAFLVRVTYRFHRSQWVPHEPNVVRTTSSKEPIRPFDGPYSNSKWDHEFDSSLIPDSYLKPDKERQRGKKHGIDPTSPSILRIKKDLEPKIQNSLTKDSFITTVMQSAEYTGSIPYEMPSSDMFARFGGWPPLEVYVDQKRGCECGGHGMVFASIARSFGIHARRFMIPHLAKGSIEGQYHFQSHMSSEFYHPKHGWIPIDCTGTSTIWGNYPLTRTTFTPDVPRIVHIFSEVPIDERSFVTGLPSPVVDLYDANNIIIERLSPT